MQRFLGFLWFYCDDCFWFDDGFVLMVWMVYLTTIERCRRDSDHWIHSWKHAAVRSSDLRWPFVQGSRRKKGHRFASKMSCLKDLNKKMTCFYMLFLFASIRDILAAQLQHTERSVAVCSAPQQQPSHAGRLAHGDCSELKNHPMLFDSCYVSFALEHGW